MGVYEKFKDFHYLIDKKQKHIIDKEYADLLDMFNEYFYKIVELSYNLKHPLNDKTIKIYENLKSSYNKIEAKSVLVHLKEYQAEEYKNSDFMITMENESNSKACCNNKCSVF